MYNGRMLPINEIVSSIRDMLGLSFIQTGTSYIYIACIIISIVVYKIRCIKLNKKMNIKNLVLGIIGAVALGRFMFAFNWSLYLGAQSINEVRQPHYIVAKSIIDDNMPFFAVFVLPYLSWWGLVFTAQPFVLFSIKDDKKPPVALKYLVTALITGVIGFSIFIIFPNIVRVGGVGWAPYNPATSGDPKFIADLVSNLFGSQTGLPSTLSNGFPSFHNVWIWSYFFVLFFHNRKSKWLYLFATTGAMISLATLFLHEHYIFDVISGIALVATVSYFVSRVMDERYRKKHAIENVISA
jgi:membrane-associated phospholipid phosphatase